jgi:hypothetical protein
MRLILRYANGMRTEALLLSESAGAMRVTIPGCNDTLEFSVEGEHWVDEQGQRASIEAMLARPEMVVTVRTMGANGY